MSDWNRLPRSMRVTRTFAMTPAQVDLALESLMNEDNEPPARRPILGDLDYAAKLCFLRGRNVTRSLSLLWTYYVQNLGRDLVEHVLRENYTLMVNNIFMRLSSSSSPVIFQTFDSLISEAFMETISLLDDHVTFLSTFPSVEIISTSAISASSDETTMEQSGLPETTSSQQ